MVGKVMGSRSCNPLQGLGRNGATKRGKKSTLDKANKQPQRGLGVAQLEKIILESQMMASYVSPLECDPDKDLGRVQLGYPSSPSASSSSVDLQHSFMIGFGDSNGGMVNGHGAFRSVATARSNQYCSSLNQAAVPLPLLEQTMQDSLQIRRLSDEQSCCTMDWMSQNSCDLQEIDLELRL